MIVRYKTLVNFNRFFCIVRVFSSNHLSSAVLSRQGKKFIETENEFAHSILARLPQYTKSMMPASLKDKRIEEIDTSACSLNFTDWEGLSMAEMCDKFRKISEEANKNSLAIADQCYNTMCNTIAKRSPEISDENLLLILNHLSLWPFGASPKEKNFYVLWKAMDNVCSSRWKSWDMDKILLFTDLWYNLNLTRQSDFVYTSITKAAMKPSRLLPHQLVQLLFYLNIMRTISKNVSMFDIEHKLGEVLNHLSIEEIGVAVMGFFKTQNVIHGENLMDYIISRIIKEAAEIPEITLTCLLKVLRGSITIPLWDRIPVLLDALEPQIDRVSLQCSVHMNLLAAKALTLHKGTLTKISQKLINSIKNARLKDMEKVIFPLIFLNYNPPTSPCIFESVVKEINCSDRTNEFDQYRKSLIALIYYLTLRNIFVEDAVTKVLDMSFIRQTYGRTNFMISREILGIDTYVELIHPTYTGPKLPTEVRNYLSKRYSTFVPDPKRKLSIHAKFTLDVFQTAKELLGEKCVIYKYVVPHHSRADVVFHLRSDGEPLLIPDDYRNIEDFTGPVRAPDVGEWFALMIASRNMYLHNVPVLTGETSSKLDLLRTLGYKPILVCFWEWPSNKEAKLAYLRKLIYSKER